MQIFYSILCLVVYYFLIDPEDVMAATVSNQIVSCIINKYHCYNNDKFAACNYYFSGLCKPYRGKDAEYPTRVLYMEDGWRALVGSYNADDAE